MPVQMCVGEIKYAPARDIVYLYPSIVEDVAGRLEDAKYAPLHDWLNAEGVTLDDLGEACAAYCRFLNIAHQEPTERIEDALRRSGWLAVPAPAQVAYMFYIGAMMTGTFFRGIRDVLPEGSDTIKSVKQLVWAGKRAQIVMSMGPARRRLYYMSKWFRRHIWRRNSIREG